MVRHRNCDIILEYRGRFNDLWCCNPEIGIPKFESFGQRDGGISSCPHRLSVDGKISFPIVNTNKRMQMSFIRTVLHSLSLITFSVIVSGAESLSAVSAWVRRSPRPPKGHTRAIGFPIYVWMASENGAGCSLQRYDYSNVAR